MPKKKGVSREDNRKSLALAAVSLAEEVGWQHVTICGIANRANVNRSTFHRNFATKEEAVRAWYLMLVDEGLSCAYSTSNMHEYLSAIFEVFASNRRILLALHRSHLSYLLLEGLNQAFAGRLDDPDVTQRLALYYHAGGIFNSFMLWFDTGMTMSAQELAGVCASVLNDDAKPLLPRIVKLRDKP